MNDRDLLFQTSARLTVCSAHLEPYIDEPAWAVEDWEYDAFLAHHGRPMRCARCKGEDHERGRDSDDADFPRAVRSQRDDRDGMVGASGDEIARQFESFLRHPSQT